MLRDAIAEIDEQGRKQPAAIVIGREGWSAGIVGASWLAGSPIATRAR